MNTELKALLTVIFDVILLGKDVVQKDYYALVGDIFKLLENAPNAINHIDSLAAEIKALSGSEQQGDLLEFIRHELSLRFPPQHKGQIP